jgi:phenylacetate-CoA ligase
MPDLSLYRRGLAAAVFSSGWSRDQLEESQSRCLRKLARHAFDRVPFYRDLFRQHGLDPAEIRGIHDLHRLPFALRSEMQERSEADLVSSGIDPQSLIVHRTSGATGAPFTIRRTRFEERLLSSVRLRETLKLGLRLSDVRAAITVGHEWKYGRRVGRPWYARLGLLRKHNVGCLLPAREILTRLEEIQPDLLGGYPSTLAWIAGEATEEDRRRIRPRYITTGAETLTPEMRLQISACFGVPVYDFYGAHEFNLIASQCRETGLYHVSECSVIVEVLRDGEPVQPGESGELFGTALHSFAMPFLRYPLGDLVTRGPLRCPCGAPNSTLQSIQGRTIDRFPLPDGTTIHPYHLLGPLVRNAPWLRRYQIIQEKIDCIVVRVVALAGQAPTQDDLGRLRLRMAEAVGAGIRITLELLKELPPAESGKFRPYYTLVREDSRPKRPSDIP